MQGLTWAPRRASIERLAEGETSMSVLADHLAVTLPAVDKRLSTDPEEKR
jgi:hypothetical protein